MAESCKAGRPLFETLFKLFTMVFFENSEEVARQMTQANWFKSMSELDQKDFLRLLARFRLNVIYDCEMQTIKFTDQLKIAAKTFTH